MEPKRLITGWTLQGGAVYRAAFSAAVPLGEVRTLKVNGVTYTLGTTTTPAAGEFFHDITAGFIYVRLLDDSDPSGAGKSVIGFFERYFGTKTSQTWRVPTDDTTRVVDFEGLIQRSPKRKDSLKDVLFGFAPDQRTSITLINTDHNFESIIISKVSFTIRALTSERFASFIGSAGRISPRAESSYSRALRKTLLIATRRSRSTYSIKGIYLTKNIVIRRLTRIFLISRHFRAWTRDSRISQSLNISESSKIRRE